MGQQQLQLQPHQPHPQQHHRQQQQQQWGGEWSPTEGCVRCCSSAPKTILPARQASALVGQRAGAARRDAGVRVVESQSCCYSKQQWTWTVAGARRCIGIQLTRGWFRPRPPTPTSAHFPTHTRRRDLRDLKQHNASLVREEVHQHQHQQHTISNAAARTPRESGGAYSGADAAGASVLHPAACSGCDFPW
jgi:hypothetical protein